MKQKLLLIFLSLAAFAWDASAQVPGFLGKKFSVSYSAALFPSFQPKANASGDYHNVAGLNLRHDFNVDYVVSKSVALGFSVKYLATMLNDALYTDEDYNSELVKAFYGDVHLGGPGFGFFVKKYAYKKKGFIAPVGFYYKWELLYAKVKITSSKAEAPHSYNEFSYVHDIYDLEDISFESQPIYGISFSYGNQIFFSDALFLDTSGSLCLTNTGIQDGSSKGAYSDNAAYLSEDVKNRLSGYLLLNFNIGIGYMLF